MGARAFVALAIAAVLGAGCTGDPEPKIADPTPSASVASPSPTESEAADPEQAYRDFIAGYVAAISESLSTGDPSAWLNMSHPRCKNCRNLERGLGDAYRDGGRIEGGSWRVESATFRETGALGDVWDVTIAQHEERWLDGAGELVKVVPATTSEVGLAIENDGQALVVRELDLTQS